MIPGRMAFAGLCLLHLSAFGAQVPKGQWWNPKDKATFVERRDVDGMAPTGFLDQYGQVPLVAISSSPILAKAIQMGGWTKIHAPDKAMAKKIFDFLQSRRGKPGWDLVCETLRIQVLAESDVDAYKLFMKEYTQRSTALSPELSFGLSELGQLWSRRSKKIHVLGLSLKNWEHWTPKDRRASAAHTLLWLSGRIFGEPMIPVIEAASIIGRQDASDYAFIKMAGRSWVAACWPSQRVPDKLVPRAVRVLPPDKLAREAVERLRTHPRDWVAAYAAFLMYSVMKMDDETVKYGKLYLQMADKTSVHLAEVQKTIDSINSRKKAKAKAGSG